MVKFGFRRKLHIGETATETATASNNRPIRRFISSLSASWCESGSLTTLESLPKNRKVLPSNVISTMQHKGHQLVLVPAKTSHENNEQEPDWDNNCIASQESFESVEEKQDWYDPVVVSKRPDVVNEVTVMTESTSVASGRQSLQHDPSAGRSSEPSLSGTTSIISEKKVGDISSLSILDEERSTTTFSDQLYTFLRKSFSMDPSITEDKNERKQNKAAKEMRQDEEIFEQEKDENRDYPKNLVQNEEDEESSQNIFYQLGVSHTFDQLFHKLRYPALQPKSGGNTRQLQQLTTLTEEAAEEEEREGEDSLKIEKNSTPSQENSDDMAEWSKMDEEVEDLVASNSSSAARLMESISSVPGIAISDDYSLSGHEPTCNRQSRPPTLSFQHSEKTHTMKANVAHNQVPGEHHGKASMGKVKRESKPFRRVQSELPNNLVHSESPLRRHHSSQSVYIENGRLNPAVKESCITTPSDSSNENPVNRGKTEWILPPFDGKPNKISQSSQRAPRKVVSSNSSVAESTVSEAFQLDPSNKTDFGFLSPFRALDYALEDDDDDDDTATQHSSCSTLYTRDTGYTKESTAHTRYTRETMYSRASSAFQTVDPLNFMPWDDLDDFSTTSTLDTLTVGSAEPLRAEKNESTTTVGRPSR